jgi:hypothetical protein
MRMRPGLSGRERSDDGAVAAEEGAASITARKSLAFSASPAHRKR